jgi:hypothetical protein
MAPLDIQNCPQWAPQKFCDDPAERPATSRLYRDEVHSRRSEPTLGLIVRSDAAGGETDAELEGGSGIPGPRRSLVGRGGKAMITTEECFENAPFEADESVKGDTVLEGYRDSRACGSPGRFVMRAERRSRRER